MDDGVEAEASEVSAEFRGRMNKNLDSLTGLRGVAAVVVFLAHFEIHKSIPFLQHFIGFLSWHNAAVDIFFVLSGFTLAYVYSGQDFDFKKYFVARFARIYPLYFLSLLLGIYVVYHHHSRTYTYDAFRLDCLRQFFLVSCWAPVGTGTCFNPPSWSISVEMFCYIFLFPPLVIFQASWRKLYNQYFTPALLLILMSGSYFIFKNYFDPELLQGGTHDTAVPFSYYVNIFRGIIGFSVGYVAHISFRTDDAFSRFCRRYSDFIFGCALLLMLGHQLNIGVSNHMLVIISPFLCLACASGTGYVNRVLSSRLFLHLGDLSYSIYLIHYLVILYVVTWARSYSGSPFLIPVVYLLSAASYYLYERPTRTLINKLFQSPPKLVAAFNFATGRE